MFVRSATSYRKCTDEASWLWPKSADMHSLNNQLPCPASCNACQYRAWPISGRCAQETQSAMDTSELRTSDPKKNKTSTSTDNRIGFAGSSHPAMLSVTCHSGPFPRTRLEEKRNATVQSYVRKAGRPKKGVPSPCKTLPPRPSRDVRERPGRR